MKALWNGEVIAESDDTVVVESNHYFPRSALRSDFFSQSERTSNCFWKGEARYLNVVVDGAINENAAWFYPEPKDAAANIRDRVAFWNGVEVVS